MNIVLEYIVFILIILFIHMLAINTQNITSNQYFYGVYIKKINNNDCFDIDSIEDLEKGNKYINQLK